MNIIDFFKTHTCGTVISSKTVGRMRLDIEDVTIFQPNLRTINQDAREKYFLLMKEQKTETGYTLMPTYKACGLHSSAIMPIVNIEVKAGTDEYECLIDYDISAKQGLKIMPLALSLIFMGTGLLGITANVISGDFYNILPKLMINLIMIAIPFAFFYWGFWYPCNRTIEVLKWLAETDIK